MDYIFKCHLTWISLSYFKCIDVCVYWFSKNSKTINSQKSPIFFLFKFLSPFLYIILFYKLEVVWSSPIQADIYWKILKSKTVVLNQCHHQLRLQSISIFLHPIDLCYVACTWYNYNRSKVCVKERTPRKYRLTHWSLLFIFYGKVKVLQLCLSLIILYEQKKEG